ncbi:MAG TPA: PQQ-binding-like beta-propeller repeat protein [Actinomycetota bacterium]|nr:PQQ-binding-like beta-propeller repeat protein [Actinomycetota bacterium]
MRPDAPAGQHFSAPVVDGTTMFVTGPDALYAFDTSTGTQLWRDARDAPPVPVAVASVGKIRAVVYTTGRDADTSKVIAVDAATGKEVWAAPVTLQDVSRTGLTIDGGRAFVGDESGHVYAVDLADGAIAWTGKTPGKLAGPVAVGGGVVVAVAAATDTSTSTTIVGFDESTGDESWSVVPDAAASFASLATIVDGNAVVAFPEGTVQGLSLEDGTASWSTRIPALVSPFVASAAADGSVLVADSNGGVHRVTPVGDDGWLYEFNVAILRASPVVVGHVVVLGLEDGSLGAVDRDSGHLVFHTAASSAPIDGLAVTPDTLVVVRSGAGRPTITGYTTDPDGRLLDEQSPTVPVPGDLALGFVLALAVGAVIVVPARMLGARRRVEDPSETSGEDGRDERDETDAPGQEWP